METFYLIILIQCGTNDTVFSRLQNICFTNIKDHHILVLQCDEKLIINILSTNPFCLTFLFRKRKRLKYPTQMKMLKEFLSKGLSAAGISHVVTAKSLFRRILWILVLIMITVSMMYMTYNVLQEYLKYPIVAHTKVTTSVSIVNSTIFLISIFRIHKNLI